MQEIWIHRDERNRVVEIVSQGIADEPTAFDLVLRFLRSADATLREYLHVGVQLSTEEEVRLLVDRQDAHLDREVDAVMEGLAIALHMLADDYPTDLAVNEPTVKVVV